MRTSQKDIDDFLNLLDSPYPSKNLLEYWIRHYSDGNYPKHTELGGKWLIFCSKEKVDETWEQIKEAQNMGQLGNISKVATARQNGKYKNHVICVYTYDSTDEKDVLRVRESLRKLGFEKPLHYKRDIETINGVYGSSNEFLLTI